ncbi:hypothetical protein Moror_9455 [Moniliophthora roreri MCA 2997]|uniref:Uncharacterized protein n=1 Tax=Moniliophthora roreri (strain MCA 2997) TaxID=1381753 RepID=V2WZN1_MONRO|nr:hypothetical protein Moror_9455 [Moniliophthora roreri MCA 2997]KAI3603755.1 hypothetical protein WG66_006730 [Moniliophthora roreri]
MPNSPSAANMCENPWCLLRVKASRVTRRITALGANELVGFGNVFVDTELKYLREDVVGKLENGMENGFTFVKIGYLHIKRRHHAQNFRMFLLCSIEFAWQKGVIALEYGIGNRRFVGDVVVSYSLPNTKATT